MVTDFPAKDKASGIKFFTVVHRRPGQGISHFGELFSPGSSPGSPKSDLCGYANHMGLEHAWPVRLPFHPACWLRIGSACMDRGEFALTYLFVCMLSVAWTNCRPVCRLQCSCSAVFNCLRQRRAALFDQVKSDVDHGGAQQQHGAVWWKDCSGLDGRVSLHIFVVLITSCRSLHFDSSSCLRNQRQENLLASWWWPE